jgi:hypothetical protein
VGDQENFATTAFLHLIKILANPHSGFYRFRFFPFRVLQITAFFFPGFTDSGFSHSAFYRFRLFRLRILKILGFLVPDLKDSRFLRSGF